MELNIKKLEVFDRLTEKKYKRSSAMLSLDIDGSRMRLNVAAVELLALHGVNKDLQVKFFRFNNAWYMALTLESSGYNITLENKDRSGGTVGAATVMHLLLSHRPRISHYYLQETDHELAGYKLYELLPNTGKQKEN